MLVDPGLFRVVDETVRTITKGKGSLHVIQLNVQQEGMDIQGFKRVGSAS